MSFRVYVLARRERVADSRLDVTPPTVVRAAKAHQVLAPGVIARQAHGLHNRLGAGHVQRYFVESGDLAQPHHVVDHDRMVGAEHRSELAHPLAAPRDALLVEVVAEQVHPVGASQVVKGIAVEIGDVGLRRDDCRKVPPCAGARAPCGLNWNGTR